jgi:hypothetical protein
MWQAAVAGLGGQILSGVLGEVFAGKSDAEFEDIKAQGLGPAEAGNADPRLMAEQESVLGKLKGVEAGGGYNIEQQAAMEKALNQLARKTHSDNAALQTQAAGMGSGAAMAAQLQNQQASAQQAHETGMGIAAQGQRNYLDSIMSRGRLASTMTDEDMRRKQARDSISQYNASAQERAANMRNQMAQQGHQNRMGQAAAQNNIRMKKAETAAQRAERLRKMFAGIGAAGFETGNAVGGYTKPPVK